MEAGFSKKKITPPIGTVMGGHPGFKRAERVRDDLFVRAMALRDSGEIFVFVSADVLFVESRSVKAIKEAVQKESEINPEYLFIGATHTHSGPITSGLFGNEQEEDYVDFFQEAATRAVLEAVGNLQEAAIGFGRGYLPGLAFNARFLKQNGRVETHPWRDDPDILEPEGPVDDSVTFLYAKDSAGKLLGGMINYANHPQVMARQDPSISADFPGSIERNIQAAGDEEAVILFANGCCGDLCPVNAQSTENREVGERWLEHMGSLLCEKALLLSKDGIEVSDGLKLCTGEVALKIRDIPESRLREAKEFLKAHNEEDRLLVSNYGVEGKASGYLSLEDYIHTNEWLVQEYRELLELQKIREQGEIEHIPIQAMRIGNIAVVLLPFEVFVELGLQIKSQSPFEKTIVIELTGGSFGYLPTEKAFTRQGGYETITLRSSRFVPESGALVVSKAVELLNKLEVQQNI